MCPPERSRRSGPLTTACGSPSESVGSRSVTSTSGPWRERAAMTVTRRSVSPPPPRPLRPERCRTSPPPRPPTPPRRPRTPALEGALRARGAEGGGPAGREAVAADVLRTAYPAHAVRLTADRTSLPADGRSLVFVTAEIVDAHGTVVPDAERPPVRDAARTPARVPARASGARGPPARGRAVLRTPGHPARRHARRRSLPYRRVSCVARPATGGNRTWLSAPAGTG